jgi:AcrR family transcriptional regulator
MADRKDEIIAAAIRLADQRGLDAVSMRAVAERVGVTPMALYPHVGSKAALLDAMMGRMLGELLPASASREGWQARLSDLARAGRDLTRRHPWLATLVFSQPSVDPDAVRVTDAIYEALCDAGVPPAEVPRLERLMGTFVMGFGASETLGRFGDSPRRGVRGRLPDGDLPGHARLQPMLSQEVDWDAEFEADLDDLKQLIELKARRPAGS